MHDLAHITILEKVSPIEFISVLVKILEEDIKYLNANIKFYSKLEKSVHEIINVRILELQSQLEIRKAHLTELQSEIEVYRNHVVPLYECTRKN